MVRAITLVALVAIASPVAAQAPSRESVVLLRVPVPSVSIRRAPRASIPMPLCRGHGWAGAAVGAGAGVVFGFALWSWQTSAQAELANPRVPVGDRIKAMALPVIAGAAVGFMLGESVKGPECDPAPSDGGRGDAALAAGGLHAERRVPRRHGAVPLM